MKYNHMDSFLIIARTKNGSLTLTSDDVGLKVRAELLDTQSNQDIFKMVKSGLLDKMSFAFVVSEQEWDQNGDIPKRYIKKIERLYDVSIAEIEYVNLYESWANSIYSNGTGYKLKNSYIGQSGGPALHVIDRNPGSGNSNPQIYIYNSTKIENWVSGQEAWFKAYGMSGAALALKSGIEDGIKPTGRTILKKVINPVTGLESEMLNVVLLTEPSEGSLTYDEYHNQTSGSEIDLYFVDDNDEIEYELKRSWDYLTTSGDPRIGGGQFGFAVGNNSNFANFQAMIGQLMQEGLNQSDATSAAMLASFYNLSSSEVLQVLYVYATLPQDVQTYWNAINMIIPGFENAPDYMEVLAPIPLFDGPATIILRLY